MFIFSSKITKKRFLFGIKMFKIILIISVFLLFMWLIIRPRPLPLPPIEIMEKREKGFLEWLNVLYGHQPEIVQTILNDLPNDKRIGQYDPHDALFFMEELVNHQDYFNVFYWDYSWAIEYQELNEHLSAMWKRFNFEPRWVNYREEDFYQSKDNFPIEPLFRWLQSEFLNHGAVLFIWEGLEYGWAVAVIPIKDKDDFQRACENWGCIYWFE